MVTVPPPGAIIGPDYFAPEAVVLPLRPSQVSSKRYWLSIKIHQALALAVASRKANMTVDAFINNVLRYESVTV